MLHPTCRLLALVCGGALLALSPASASADGSGTSPANLQVDSVREVLQAAGYTVGAPFAWDEQALATRRGSSCFRHAPGGPRTPPATPPAVE